MTHNEAPSALLESLVVAWPPEGWRDTSAIIAVSGGPDSVALARLVSLAKQRFAGAGRMYVAHFDHGWRTDSGDDALFVRELAASLGLGFELGSAPCRHPAPSEESARLHRYQFLTDTALRLGARWVAIGHTADDQIETIVHHLVRGTGLHGLAGMPPTRQLHEAVTLVRPMLNVRRFELHQWLHTIGQPFRDDSTNRSVDFTRTRIRYELMPLLADFNPHVDAAILRLGQLSRDAAQYISEQASELLRQALVRSDDTSVCLDLNVLRSVTPFVQREAMIELWHARQWPMQSMGYDKWSKLQQFIDGPAGSCQTFPGDIQAAHDERLLTVHHGPLGRS